MAERTNVYFDGFNFYYGAVKDTPYRWCDVSRLCQLLLPNHSINRIRYFTARVQPRPDDPTQPQRQQAYLRALGTIANLSIHYGHYLSYPRRMPLTHPNPGGPRTVEVLRTEEKGSDVNLATYLLMDGMEGEYEVAVIVSNDSDLKAPLEVVRSRFHCKVGILNPHKNRSWALAQVIDFYKPIRRGTLAASQFPLILHDASGPIHKPAAW